MKLLVEPAYLSNIRLFMARNSEVNFRLKPIDEKGKCLIYLQFLYNRQRLFFSFGQRIEPGSWNLAKQRVKSNKQTTEDGQHSLNDLLDNLERVCIKAYNEELKNGIPGPETIKAYLKAFINQQEPDPDKPTLHKLIDRFINNEIKNKGRDKSGNTINTYQTCLGHLNEFEAKEKAFLDFKDIDLDFYYKYVSFLKKKGLLPNSIAKDIQILKVFMGEAVDLGFTTNLQFRHKKFAVNREETDAVFLTENEITKLYKHDFSESKKLERVRDLFVFGCYVGLRFSDYSRVKQNNIVLIDGDYFIKMITKKTQDLVIIPCNPVVMQIFEKYKHTHNNLPPAPSNQKFNDYVKDVCKAAELNEKGRLSTDPDKELWECISSHTARRSFATNYYLEGFPTIDLMKITGHRTEKAFLKYIRVTKLDTAKRLSEHIKKNWSGKLFKIA